MHITGLFNLTRFIKSVYMNIPENHVRKGVNDADFWLRKRRTANRERFRGALKSSQKLALFQTDFEKGEGN